MIAFVYRHGSTDCTNNGISSKFLMLDTIDEKNFENTVPNDTTVVIVHRYLFGGDKDYPVLVPYGLYKDYKKSRACISFGGNYGKVGEDMIPIHDRVDSWEAHEVLSR